MRRNKRGRWRDGRVIKHTREVVPKRMTDNHFVGNDDCHINLNLFEGGGCI